MVRYIESKNTMIHWKNQKLVEKSMKMLAEYNNFLAFKFTYRSGNYVDDKLVRGARKLFIYWKEELPVFQYYSESTIL